MLELKREAPVTLEAVESVLLVKVRTHFCNISLVCLGYLCVMIQKYFGGLNRIFEGFVM